MTIRLLQGDCREVLKQLPDASIHCCVSSPPYYGLRSYGVGVDNGEIGLESDPAAFIDALVEVYRQVRRVLRDDGTCWLNLGDSYNNFRSQVGPGQAVHGRDDLRGKPAPDSRRRGWHGLKEKDLLGMPWRVAFALQADGWWLRSAIVWAKPNPMPESCRDRPTSSYEMVFLLSKRATYFYDADAVREPHADWRDGHNTTTPQDQSGVRKWNPGRNEYNPLGRSCRNVWTIATAPYSDAHFATFPPELAERCIRAGTSERGCCAQCGAPWVRMVEHGAPDKDTTRGRQAWAAVTGQRDSAGGLPMRQITTTGWSPSCACNAETVPCVCLDPFGGAGTVGLVADRLGRDAVLVELSEAYCAMARDRISGEAPLFADVSTSWPPAETDAQDERLADLFSWAAD